MKIKEARARKIYNSLGQEIIEVEVKLDDNIGRGSCDFGLSKGSFEVNAYPGRIDDLIEKFNNQIAMRLKNLQIIDFDDLEEVEKVFKIFDVTEDLKEIGGHVILATEYAILRALSENGEVFKILDPKKNKFPGIVASIIGGGKHALGKGTDFQEFLVIPRTKNVAKAMKIINEIDERMEEELRKRDKNFKGERNVKGSLAPNLLNLDVLNILEKIVKKVSKVHRIEIGLGLDIAGNELWNGRRYEYKQYSKVESKRNLSREEQIELVRKVMDNYNLTYVEDPLHEEDFEGFRELNKGLGIVAGDDIIATRIERLREHEKKMSAVVIKPDQIGSLVKVKELVDYCFKHKIMPVISHRSGSSEDNMIVHLAVGWSLPLIKCNFRSDRVNELIRIKENI